MNAVTPLPARANAARKGSAATVAKHLQTLDQHVIEIMSDSGEGAQKCGQSFGSIAARTGNGVWTVEIIPAEIQPPARSVAGASGNRIRIGSHQITNGGDEADIAVAFNEQVLLGRVNAGELKAGCIVLLENMWARARRREDRRPVCGNPRPARRRRLPGLRSSHGDGVSRAGP